MVWIRLCVFCILSLSMTGSISHVLARLAGSLPHRNNPVLRLTLQKLSLFLYWIPISYMCICVPRISLQNKKVVFTGEFMCSTVPTLTAAFGLLGGAWLVGFVLAVFRSGRKQWRLIRLMRGTVPVENPRYCALFEKYKKEFGLDGIALGQNDLLTTPVATGVFGRQQVILPFAAYTDTEIRMIYEHELTHICQKDLCWRLFALVTSWVHWFNPAVSRQLRELDCAQEIVCDLRVSTDNAHFSKKEYMAFLAKLAEQEPINVCTTA
ncbi:MAG: M56 family metallopeptidase, partial [Lachnospiraceae bacterium]|nr:M56 family metallopeptidase [Lachnospiraceae bacterium]